MKLIKIENGNLIRFVQITLTRIAVGLGMFLPAPIVTAEEAPPLIDIKTLAPGIHVDLRYATTHNFTGRKLYMANDCLLCEPVAERLARVQVRLEKEGFGLKIWDCYRPVSVQEILWIVAPDQRFVANPKTGSRHNRGASIDCTLVDKNGQELPMPTEFDEFSAKAYRKNKNLPLNIIKNRDRLQEAMEREGFLGLPTEWWHFDDPEWSKFALRNEPLGDPALYKDLLAPNKNLPLSSAIKQLILVTAPTWDSVQGQLQLFRRNGNGWAAAEAQWPVVLGLKGLAWGTGLHTPVVPGPVKREGDLTTPAGVFYVGQAYGYADTPPEKTNWAYQKVTEGWVCVDDPTSTSYNKIFDCPISLKRDWDSAETMKRRDHLYKWVINVQQNAPTTLKGGGSCIFFHVWRRENSGTEGCVAMEEKNMVQLLQWLSGEDKPSAVFLPREVYEKVKKEWGLP